MEEHMVDFTVLGQVDENKQQKVDRVLPKWLSNPVVINNDLKKLSPIEELKELNTTLLANLRTNKITHLFPVQSTVIPWLLRSISQKCLPPRDLCVSAPTGSGKTLAFVLPMLQVLRQSNNVNIKALVLLPVKDLAVQVYRVFESYSKGTRLKVGLIVGEKPFPKEQTMLIRKDKSGFQSNVDIVVATPGRLVDHITLTEGFTLEHVMFVVIDEADRIFDEANKDCLKIIDEKVLEKCDRNIKNFALDLPGIPKVSSMSDVLCTGVFTPASCHWFRARPQKWLFSATLSQDPEKLQRMNLYQPKLFTSIVPKKKMVEDCSKNYIGKYTTPALLKERYVVCDVSTKPLILYYFLHKKKFRRVLCFTNTINTMHRLFLLMKKMCSPHIKVQEFSANLSVDKRDNVLKKFASGKIDLLISSDVGSRGIDFTDVNCVISYDLPKVLKTYIHRIGRTARAGKKGTAISFLENKDVKIFQNLLTVAGKSKVRDYIISNSELQVYEEQFKAALDYVSVRVKNKRN